MERLRAKFSADPRYNLDRDPTLQIGSIPGIALFQTFSNRDECVQKRVHTQRVAGISGGQKVGAYSVVLSGKYADEDMGDVIIYIGTGGYAKAKDGSIESSWNYSGPIDCDQTFDHPDNAALVRSSETKNPVRVIRSDKVRSKYAPESGYRYDGLYTVEKAYSEVGEYNFLLCKFRLRRNEGQAPIPIRTPSTT